MCGSAQFVIFLEVETHAAPADLSYAIDTILVVDVQVIFDPTLRLGIPNTVFEASNLPRGIELNPHTGIIIGAPRK